MKSGNVLVRGDFESVQLCDFGVAIRINENLTVINPNDYVGTHNWLARECLAGDKPITNKSEIYSFGLVIWEMLTLELPHTMGEEDDETDSDENSVDADMENAPGEVGDVHSNKKGDHSDPDEIAVLDASKQSCVSCTPEDPDVDGPSDPSKLDESDVCEKTELEDPRKNENTSSGFTFIIRLTMYFRIIQLSEPGHTFLKIFARCTNQTKRMKQPSPCTTFARLKIPMKDLQR
jgi:serine/threonine protein kinase